MAMRVNIDTATFENTIGTYDASFEAGRVVLDEDLKRRVLLSMRVKSCYKTATVSEGATESVMGIPTEAIHILSLDKHNRRQLWAEVREWAFLPEDEREAMRGKWLKDGILVYHGGANGRGEVPIHIARDFCIRAIELMNLVPLISIPPRLPKE